MRLLAFLVAPALALAADSQSLELSWEGGAIGGTADYGLSSPSGQLYTLLLSRQTAFVPLPSGTLLIGLQQAGFLRTGFLAAGLTTESYSVPFDVTLVGEVIYGQCAEWNVGPLVPVQFSNRVATVFADPSQFLFASNASPQVPSRAAGTGLDDGRILLTGGLSSFCATPQCVQYNSNSEPTIVVFDPLTQEFETSSAALSVGRVFHQATLLSDGRVLVSGGQSTSQSQQLQSTASAEIYDPVADTIQPVGSLASSRAGHTATLLVDGRVLVVGGTFRTGLTGLGVPAAVTELFDPATGSWTNGPLLPGLPGETLTQHSAIRLADGRVLIAAGSSWDNMAFTPGVRRKSFLFDPQTDSYAPGPDLVNHHSEAELLLRSDGTVALAGSYDLDTLPNLTGVPAEVFDPIAGTWTLLSNATVPASFPTVLVEDSNARLVVMTTENVVGQSPRTNARRFDSATGQWNLIASWADLQLPTSGLLDAFPILGGSRIAILVNKSGTSTTTTDTAASAVWQLAF